MGCELGGHATPGRFVEKMYQRAGETWKVSSPDEASTQGCVSLNPKP